MPLHNERAKRDVIRNAARQTIPRETLLSHPSKHPAIYISPLSLTLRSFIEQKAQNFPKFACLRVNFLRPAGKNPLCFAAIGVVMGQKRKK